MNRTILLAAMLLTCTMVNGQEKGCDCKPCPDKYDHVRFLDSVFCKGTATAGNMAISEAYFNYDLVNNELVFLSPENTVCKLLDAHSYIQISYGHHNFIPINSYTVGDVVKIYKNGVVLLLVRKSAHNTKAANALGNQTQTASAVNVANIEVRGNFIPIDSQNVIDCRFSSSFYLRVDGKLKPISSKKKLKKIFPGRADAIDAEYDRIIENEPALDRTKRIIDACCQ